MTETMLRSLPLVFFLVCTFLITSLVQEDLLIMIMLREACKGHLVRRWPPLFSWASIMITCAVAAFMFYLGFIRPKPVYLVDFSCFLPDDDQKCNLEKSEYISRLTERFTIPSLEFQQKIFRRSGLGEETYLPYHLFDDDGIKSREEICRLEAKQVLFGCVDSLLRKTGMDPKEIGILITNCSLYSPAPSFASMLVNRYKMKESVKAIHLGGMGCSASVIACKLAKDLLTIYPNQYALVVSTENVYLNWYLGNNKSQLVSNCLFRLGCGAMLLTNRPEERARCKYEFSHCVRTHKAANDRAHRCAYQHEDAEGFLGISLTRDLMGVAADALRSNIITLGPRVLPFSEQLLYLHSFLSRKLLNLKVKQYQPDFKLAFQHFCLHAGGRAVIDEIQKNLFLSDHHMEASRATLHRFGNTSSSCLWYVLSYMEAKQNIKKGDKVWMLGLGSGFKCNSAVWKAIDDISVAPDSPWIDCIHRYPTAFKPHLMSSSEKA